MGIKESRRSRSIMRGGSARGRGEGTKASAARGKCLNWFKHQGQYLGAGDIDPSVPDIRPAFESVDREPLQGQVRGLPVAPADRVAEVGDEGVDEDCVLRAVHPFVHSSVRSSVRSFRSLSDDWSIRVV